MSKDTLKIKIAKLRDEIECLAAKHEERLRQLASRSHSGKAHELETKRVQILRRRMRRLEEELQALQLSEAKAASSEQSDGAKCLSR